MTTIPAVSDRIRAAPVWARGLPARTAIDWLAAGWRDLWRNPWPSLTYGLLVALVSAAIVVGLFRLGWDFILLPALAGFLVTGPVLAIGLVGLIVVFPLLGHGTWHAWRAMQAGIAGA